MKKPEPPPAAEKRITDKILDFIGEPDFQEQIKISNDRYLYWDKFKYRPMPKGLKPETAWSYLKLVRRSQRRWLPITDAQGSNFSYWLPDVCQRNLHIIDTKAAGSISVAPDGLTPTNRAQYLVSSLMEEAIASSMIEGASTTRKRARELLRTGRKPQDRAEQMVLNNYTTIRNLKKLSRQKLTPEVLFQLQTSLTRNTLEYPEDAGRYRTHEDNIVVQDHGVTLHIPPPAETMPAQVERLCKFANNDCEPFIHPVVKGILLHFWLAFLHPYVDGNGRTARAVFYWYMLSRDYWLFEFLSISQAILKGRSGYDKSYLYSEIDDLDATYFVHYNLEMIVESLQKLYKFLNRKQREQEKLAAVLSELSGLNHRQQSILKRAISDTEATYTIMSHKRSHDIAYATARSDLQNLEERGLLIRDKVGRKAVFRVPPDLSERLSG